MQIRPIQLADAAAFAELLNRLDSETKFLGFEPGERRTDVEHWQQRIEQMQSDGNSMLWVAEQGGELVGFLRAAGETIQRLRHTASIVIAIRQAFTRQGIGAELFGEMEKWARVRPLYRLSLTVMTHNATAIALYQKMGFAIEGLHKAALVVDGQFIDEYTMAKLLS